MSSQTEQNDNRATENKDTLFARNAIPVGRASAPVGRAIQLFLVEKFQKLAEIADDLDHQEPEEAAEAIHDFRVTCQHMRSVLNSFADFLPGKPVRRLGKDIRKLQSSLGEARDTHILLSQKELVPGLRQQLELRLHEIMSRHTEKDNYQAIKQQIDEFRQQDVDPANEFFLSSEPMDKKGTVLLHRLDAVVPAVLYAQTAAVTAYKPFLPTAWHDSITGTADNTAASRMVRFWTESDWPSADVMHRLRLQFKQFRHTLMMLSTFWGDIGSDLISTCKDMQDQLGYLNDRRVFADAMYEYWLDSPADSSVPVVWQQLRESQAEAIQVFLKSWRRLDYNWFHDQMQPLVSWCADQVTYNIF